MYAYICECKIYGIFYNCINAQMCAYLIGGRKQVIAVAVTNIRFLFDSRSIYLFI